MKKKNSNYTPQYAKKDDELVELELEYEIDNRGSDATWLQLKDKRGNRVGYVELTVEDMFELIVNVMENNSDMDTSEVENEIEKLKGMVYARGR